MSSKKKTGSCLCEAVIITINEPVEKEVCVCHCGMCRKWCAGPFFSIEGGKETTIHIKGEENIARYQSSEWAERAFCKQCGSSLFYHSFDNDRCYVAADLFSEMDEFFLKQEIFYDCQPAYEYTSDATEKVTEAEMFATVSEEVEK